MFCFYCGTLRTSFVGAVAESAIPPTRKNKAFSLPHPAYARAMAPFGSPAVLEERGSEDATTTKIENNGDRRQKKWENRSVTKIDRNNST